MLMKRLYLSGGVLGSVLRDHGGVKIMHIAVMRVLSGSAFMG